MRPDPGFLFMLGIYGQRPNRQTAALLREKGEPVIHLGGGEPKSKTPLDAIVSCSAVLNSGDIKYTPPDGIPALKKAIIRYTEEWKRKHWRTT